MYVCLTKENAIRYIRAISFCVVMLEIEFLVPHEPTIDLLRQCIRRPTVLISIPLIDSVQKLTIELISAV